MAPGLVLSYIGPDVIYASATRCKGQKRESVLSSTRGSLLEALNDLREGWVKHRELINASAKPITKI